MNDLHIEGNHPEGVRAICKECETVVLKDTEYEAGEVVDSHNEQRHNGDEVAGICAWDIEPLLHDGQDAKQKFNVMMALEETIDLDEYTHEEKRQILGLTG